MRYEEEEQELIKFLDQHSKDIERNRAEVSKLILEVDQRIFEAKKEIHFIQIEEMLAYEDPIEKGLAELIKDSDANLLKLKDMMKEVKAAIKDIDGKS